MGGEEVWHNFYAAIYGRERRVRADMRENNKEKKRGGGTKRNVGKNLKLKESGKRLGDCQGG